MTSPRIHTKPFPSLLLGAAGGALVGGRARRSAGGALAALAGLALVGVAASGPVGHALRRAGTRRRTACVRLSFVVPHPVNTVFRFCSDFENYPKFIRALREVHDFGDGRSHWVGWSPSGRLVEWDAVTTKFVPGRVVAWQSTPRSDVRVSCSIRLLPDRGGATCVRVAVYYSWPTERIKEAVTAIASRKRTRELESDILRLGEQLDALADATPPA